MPDDVPVEPEPTPASVENEESLLDVQSAAELDLDLEEVVAEETLPPTPVRPVKRAPDPLEAEPEPALMEDDEPDFTFGSLVREDEDAAAEVDADLAPLRRASPVATTARPATPPRAATPPVAKPVAAAKPAAPAKPATPAKPSPAIPASGEDSFDLRNLVDEVDDAPALAPKPAARTLTTPPPTPAPRPAPAPAPGAAKPAPAKPFAAEKDSDDDDLDALFDEIQIGD